MYEYSIESITDYGCRVEENLPDVHNATHANEHLDILTFYEKQHIAAGLAIKHIRVTLPTKEAV